jgi:hypothetical protein
VLENSVGQCVAQILLVEEVYPEINATWGRRYLLPTKSVAHRNVDKDFRRYGAIVQNNRDSISDATFRGIMVISCNLRIFETGNFLAKSIDARILCDIVFIILCGQTAMNQGDCNLLLAESRGVYHVLYTVISVCGVMQRTLFVNDVDTCFLSADFNLLDVIC